MAALNVINPEGTLLPNPLPPTDVVLEAELALFHRIVGAAQQQCSGFRCGEPAVVDEFLPDIDGTGLGGWLYWCKTHQAEKLAMIEGAQQQLRDGQCSTIDKILDALPKEVV